MGPGRFLAASPRLRAAHLQLLERTADGLSTVASRTDAAPMVASSDDTRILPFGGSDLVGVIDRSLSCELAIFSIADDDIERVTTFDSSRFGAGHGRHLWRCRGSSGLERIDIDDPDGPAPSLESPDGCGSVSVNDDGSRVYVRRSGAVGVVDAEPTEDGDDPVLLEEVPGSAASVPRFSGGHLLLIEPGAVRLFQEREGLPAVEEVSVVPVEDVRAATQSLLQHSTSAPHSVPSGLQTVPSVWQVPSQLNEQHSLAVSQDAPEDRQKVSSMQVLSPAPSASHSGPPQHSIVDSQGSPRPTQVARERATGCRYGG
ncbi:MAG: hypothetical protein ACODAG_00260 [Myxococcota bacterium]